MGIFNGGSAIAEGGRPPLRIRETVKRLLERKSETPEQRAAKRCKRRGHHLFTITTATLGKRCACGAYPPESQIVPF